MTERGPAPIDPPGAIVAVTANDDRYRAVLDRAAVVARAEKRALILYDWDSPSLFASPLPTNWSGDGSGERPDGPLDESELKMAGRADLAAQVARLLAAGIETRAWLPSDAGGAALGAYALEQGAAVVVVPAGLPGIDAAAGLRVIEVEG
jgi:hypothetical protein